MNSKITLKELLEVAEAELRSLTAVSNPDFRLEQAEFNESNNEWDIVVSYLVENTNKRIKPLGLPISEFEYYRIYKKLKVDSAKEIVGLYIFNN
jgi:hypothetical protein